MYNKCFGTKTDKKLHDKRYFERQLKGLTFSPKNVYNIGMTIKNLLQDIPYAISGHEIRFDIDDFEEVKARYFNAVIDSAIRESEEDYARTGIEHDGRKVLADLRAKYVRKI